MSFLGIGSLELIIILLVAFIFLGPERMVDAARMLGRLTRQVRKMTAEVREMVDVDELINSPRDGQASGSDDAPNQLGTNPSGDAKADDAAADSGSSPESDGPVSFKSARKSEAGSTDKNGTENAKDINSEKPDKRPTGQETGSVESQEERS